MNTDDEPLTLELKSAYGTKKIQNVQPGKSVSQAFSTRAIGITAGAAQVVATTAGGAAATVDAAYPAATCG